MKKFTSVFLSTILCLCFAPALARDFYTGKNFRVTGVWSGNELRAERVQLREPATDPKRGQIVAYISAVDVNARTLKTGPLTIEWNEQTQFKGLTAAKLAVGVAVRLSVETRGEARLLATSVQPPSSPLPKDTVQLTGVVSLTQPVSDGARRLTLMGTSVVTPQAGYNAVESLTRRQDTRRPEQPFRVPLFGRPLTITGAYDGSLHERRNFELDGTEKRTDFDHEFKVEFFYPLRERIYLFAEIQAQYEAELRNTGNDLNSDKSLERGQMWVFFDRLAGSGFGLQLGRQNLREKREWWWDTDLDAARLYYDNGPFHVELGAGQELARVSTLQKRIAPEQNRVARLMATGSWQWASKQTIEVFALRQQDRSRTETEGARLNEIDEDPSDARLTWLGIRAIGDRSLDNYGDLIYWADAAWVRGRESSLGFDTDDDGISTVDERQDVKVRGTAFDVGVSWRTPLPWQPAFTLGYARASGDDSLDDGVDSAFRQTGLHNNKWRFFGVNRFRYYGELFRPELSNLNVVTAAVGFQFLKNSSVELLYHRYRQTKAADAMRDVRIDADLSGESRALGHEFDLVFGFREWAHVDLSVALATFKAGSAYGSFAGKRANSLLFELTYNF
jgi:alginate production protein